MKTRLTGSSRPLQLGLTLIELLITLVMSALLIIGLIQIVMAASSSFRLQDNQAEVQETGRYAVSTLAKLIRQIGFNPQPWNPDFEPQGLTAETQDQVTTRTDRLAIRFWSDTNCFDNRNPVEDEFGQAAFYIRESVFDLNSQNNLAHTCRYGPTPTELVTQVNHQGFIRNVVSFQALYGEDNNDDGHVDHWVKAGAWSEQERVLGIRMALLLRSSDPVVEAVARSYAVLDTEYTVAADGKLHRLLVFSTAIRGRSG